MNVLVSSVLLLQTMTMMTKTAVCFPISVSLTRVTRFSHRIYASSPDVPSKRRFSAWGEGSDRSGSAPESRQDGSRSSYERPQNRNIDGREYGGSNTFDRQESRDSSSQGRGGASFGRTTYRRDDNGASSSSRNSGGGGYQGNSYSRDNSYEENKEPPCGYYDGDHLYGISPIRLAIASNRRNISELLIQEGMEISNKKDEKSAFEILKIAKEKGITVREFPKHDLNMLTDNRPHQGFVLRAAPLQFTRLDSLPKSESFQCVLALDEVWDPQNFGALLRTSHFLGVDKVVVCAKNSAPLSPTVSKASSGALEIIEVSSTDNMMRFLDKSQENGWQVSYISSCVISYLTI
jgi:tRNA G18 (ribose-2'-O)-methylase SpoU